MLNFVLDFGFQIVMAVFFSGKLNSRELVGDITLCKYLLQLK